MHDDTTKRDGRLASIEGDFLVDEKLLDLFPPDATILAAEHYGQSAWTQTGCVTVELEDGSVKKYFLKLALGDQGRELLLGEFTSITLLHNLMPGLVPEPLGWGKYSTAVPDTYFFIEDFKDMDMGLPNPVQLARQTADLHENLSPDGKFGFEVTTFAGKVPHPKGWESNWTLFFARLLELCLEADEKTNGHWHELRLASNQILSVVVPRLLDPLQQGSDPIRPVLIHGDLWSGNIGTDEETGNLVFFDCGCLYAHSELELGMWRSSCDGARNLGVRYLREYQKIVGPSKPEAEFDDRNRLYCAKYNLTHSALNPGDIARQYALNDMAFLCEKYAPLEGIPRYDPKQDYAWKSRT